MSKYSRPATQPLRVVSIVLYFSVLFTSFFQQWLGLPPDRVWNPPLLIAGLSCLVALEWFEQRYFGLRPPLHLAIGSLLLRYALVEFVGLYDPSEFFRFIYLIPPALAYLYIGPAASYAWAIFNYAIGWYSFVRCCGASWWTNKGDVFDMLLILIGVIFTVLMARTVVMQEESQQRAEALVKELEASQLRIAELAAVDERNRIARDIHDSVGHHLTAINIQLEKAIAFRPINAIEADQALHDAKRSAKSALADVRDSVSALRDRDPKFGLTVALRQLVNGFGRIPITLHIEGDESAYAKSSLIALYRAAQEGLTNIEKHAGANSAELKVMLQPEKATLWLKDDGIGVNKTDLEQKATSSQGHFGLLGLRERLELLGGTLTIDKQEPCGTLLRVQVPAQGLG
ncbi:MAG: sensor histidine kinase [Candidatus Promineifilaceae bacterium]